MAYLLSLLTPESPSKKSTQILCYYTNDTYDNQIVRAISGVTCHFELVVFPEERILFEELPELYLEVYSSLISGPQSNKIDCKLLRINEMSESCKIS
jgi:hypothetical protein